MTLTMPRKKLIGIKLWKNWEFTLYLQDQEGQWSIIEEHENRIRKLEERCDTLQTYVENGWQV